MLDVPSRDIYSSNGAGFLSRWGVEYCQTPGLVFRLGVDFVLPCYKKNKNNKKKPHKNLSERCVLEGSRIDNLRAFGLSLGG